jgi:hypothetical protein
MNTETLPGNTSTEPEQQATAESTTLLGGDQQEQGQAEQLTPEVKAEEAKTEEEKPSVPDEYQDFVAPEEIQLDTELIGEFKAKAKDMGLTQDKAQEVVDLGVKLQQKWQATQMQAIEQARTQWVEQANSDKEFGGEKLTENLSVAKKALDTFGTPELKQLLNDSGLGNHPEIIRAFYRAGKSISEDRFVGGGNGPSGSVDPAKVLFPTMN